MEWQANSLQVSFVGTPRRERRRGVRVPTGGQPWARKTPASAWELQGNWSTPHSPGCSAKGKHTGRNRQVPEHHRHPDDDRGQEIAHVSARTGNPHARQNQQHKISMCNIIISPFVRHRAENAVALPECTTRPYWHTPGYIKDRSTGLLCVDAQYRDTITPSTTGLSMVDIAAHTSLVKPLAGTK